MQNPRVQSAASDLTKSSPVPRTPPCGDELGPESRIQPNCLDGRADGERGRLGKESIRSPFEPYTRMDMEVLKTVPSYHGFIHVAYKQTNGFQVLAVTNYVLITNSIFL